MCAKQAGRVNAIGAAFVCLGLILLLTTPSFGQDYPTKPINVLSGYAPGGTVDIAFRPLAAVAEKSLGQAFIITNNGAGNGTVALGIHARQKPDGYHLGVFHSGLLTCIPHLRTTLPYKPDDFVPVMTFGTPLNTIGVKADAPWKTLKELIEAARKAPGKITYYAATPGSPINLNIEYVARAEKVQFKYVPFAGGAPALTALLGGHINFFGGAGSLIPQARTGQTRLLAIMGRERMKDFPDVPTLKELGYDFLAEDVFSFYAPKGVPAAVIKKLDAGLRASMKDPTFVQALEKLGVFNTYMSSDDTRKYLTRASVDFGKMIKEYNIPKED